MNRTLVETAIRNVLRIVGAAIAAKGYAQSADLEVLIGVLAVIAGEAWSFYEKRNRIPDDTTKTTQKEAKAPPDNQ